METADQKVDSGHGKRNCNQAIVWKRGTFDGDGPTKGGFWEWMMQLQPSHCLGTRGIDGDGPPKGGFWEWMMQLQPSLFLKTRDI